MGCWKYRKKEPSHVQGVCVRCGSSPQTGKGKGKFRALCFKCFRQVHNQTSSGRVDKRKPHCEQCGFVAVHMCQLDLDHIDGNHSNNDPNNLQTLCSNCHRLKTTLNKDYLPTILVS